MLTESDRTLGKLLLDAGAISSEDLQHALSSLERHRQSQPKLSLARLLIQEALVEGAIVERVAPKVKCGGCGKTFRANGI